MARKLSGIQIARRISLGFFLVLTTTLTILHQHLPGWPSIDGLCPFGGLETLYAFIAGGSLLKNIHPGNIVLLVATIILAITLGRFFCGWICALGSLQGIAGSLGQRVLKRRFQVPAALDRPLRLLKYVALALILVFTWTLGSLVIRPFDPWAAWGHISAPWQELWLEFGIGLIILALSLILSFFYDRVFCKYLCPLGAFNALVARIPLFRIQRVASTCTDCKLCNRRCMMNIPVAQVQSVDSPECIACLECVTACPTKPVSLQVRLGGSKPKLWLVPVLGLGIYLLTIGIGNLLGYGRFGPANVRDLAAAGALTVDDIKGSSTWQDVGLAFGLESRTIMEECGIDPAKVPATAKIKDTAALVGLARFESEVVREVVARLKGLPWTPEGVKPAPQPGSGLQVPADFELEGTMSINDIAQALQTSPEAVLAKLGLSPDLPRDKPLRDLKEQGGFSMPELKQKIHQ